MTDDVDFYGFLLAQQPICTQSPLKRELGPELHSKLRAKCNLELGMDLLADKCHSMLLCNVTNDKCIGRPLPDYPEVREALRSLKMPFRESEYRSVGVLMVSTRIDCDKCPFEAICTTPCASQESFMRKKLRDTFEPKEHMLVPYEDFERGKYKALDEYAFEHCELDSAWMDQKLPLDCLTDMQRKVMELTLWERLSQTEVGHKLNIGQPRVALHISRSTEKMYEYGLARKAIREALYVPRRVVDYYVGNMTHQEIANKETKDRSVISKFINKWRDDNGIE